jgi:hypothetical protein
MKPRSHRRSDLEAAVGGGVVVRSDDGAIAYRLRRTQAGVLVERERKRAVDRARLTQTAFFRNAAGFMRWSDADSIRFDYPVIFSAVRREVGALFDDCGCNCDGHDDRDDDHEHGPHAR